MSAFTRRQILRTGLGYATAGGFAFVGGGCLLDPPKGTRVMGRRVAPTEWTIAGGPPPAAGPVLGGPAVLLRAPAGSSVASAMLVRTQPVDLRNRALRLRLRLEEDAAENLERIDVRIGAGLTAFESSSFQSVVIRDRVDGFNSEYLKPGEDVVLTLGPASFAGARLDEGLFYDTLQDFAITIVSRPGRGAAVALGVLDVVAGPAKRPRGIVSFCFDDGLISTRTRALPVLSRHGFPATSFLIGDLLGEAGYLDGAGVRSLVDAGWEAAPHAESIALHNAPDGVVGVSPGRLLADWGAQRRALRSAALGRAVDYAYPRGRFDRDTLQALARFGHFATARTENFRSIETLPPADPLRLRTISYNQSVPIGPPDRVGSIMWRIAQTAAYGGWLILSFHDIVDGVPAGSAIRTSDFERIVGFVARKRVPVRTIAQVRREVFGEGSQK